MAEVFYQKKSKFFRKAVCGFVAVTFSASLVVFPVPTANAQYISNLPNPGEMVLLSPAFQPPVLKGMTLHPENPLHFDFIVDRGQDKLSGDALKEETQKLLKYFLAAMTIPDDESWVNLSPYEGDRIVPDMLGATDMGKAMLEQDYLLKQLSASLTNPQEEIGKKFWNTVYKKAYEKFKTTSIPINTFNKVWITPDRAEILEQDGYVFIGDTHLKVMLDEDYTSLKEDLKNKQFGTEGVTKNKVEELSKVSSDVVREIIIPELEKEINQGKNFAAVRQMYHSVILATWYKQNLKNSLLGKVYVDKSKIAGVDIAEKDVKQKVYEQYLAAFRKGVYNLIKEDYDLASKEVLPRKYFSGGVVWARTSSALTEPSGFKRTELMEGIQKAYGAGEFEILGAVFEERASAGVVGRGVSAARASSANQTIPVAESSPTTSIVYPAEKVRRLDPRVDDADYVRGWLENYINENGKGRESLLNAFNEFESMLKRSGQGTVLVNTAMDRLQQAIDELNFAKTGRTIGKINFEFPVPPQFVEDILADSSSQEALQDAIGRFAGTNGMVVRHIIAGGMASRLAVLKKRYNIHGFNGIWDLKINVIRELQAAIHKRQLQGLGLEDSERELLAMEIPENMNDYSVGQWHMMALAQAISELNVDDETKDKIRQNHVIVVYVNNDVKDQVEKDFIEYGFFGFNPKNIIFFNGGYGPQFKIKEGVKAGDSVELVKHSTLSRGRKVTPETSYSHGYALAQGVAVGGLAYTLTQFSSLKKIERNFIGQPLAEYLGTDNDNVITMIDRINDLGLLAPAGALGLDMLTALLVKRKQQSDQGIPEEARVGAIAEMVARPRGSKEKGGEPWGRSDLSEYAALIEGLNFKMGNNKVGDVEGLAGKLEKLKWFQERFSAVKPADVLLKDVFEAWYQEHPDPFYNRARTVSIARLTNAALVNLPVSTKLAYFEGVPLLSLEIPFGDMTNMINTLAVVSKTDPMYSAGILNQAYAVREGFRIGEDVTRIHDTKNEQQLRKVFFAIMTGLSARYPSIKQDILKFSITSDQRKFLAQELMKKKQFMRDRSFFIQLLAFPWGSDYREEIKLTSADIDSFSLSMASLGVSRQQIVASLQHFGFRKDGEGYILDNLKYSVGEEKFQKAINDNGNNRNGSSSTVVEVAPGAPLSLSISDLATEQGLVIRIGQEVSYQLSLNFSNPQWIERVTRGGVILPLTEPILGFRDKELAVTMKNGELKIESVGQSTLQVTGLIPKAAASTAIVNSAGKSMNQLIAEALVEFSPADRGEVSKRLRWLMSNDPWGGAANYENEYRKMTVAELGQQLPEFIGLDRPFNQAPFVNNRDTLSQAGVRGFLDLYSRKYPQGGYEGNIKEFFGDFVVNSLINPREDNLKSLGLPPEIVARILASQERAGELTLRAKAWVREVLLRSGVPGPELSAASTSVNDSSFGMPTETLEPGKNFSVPMGELSLSQQTKFVVNPGSQKPIVFYIDWEKESGLFIKKVAEWTTEGTLVEPPESILIGSPGKYAEYNNGGVKVSITQGPDGIDRLNIFNSSGYPLQFGQLRASAPGADNTTVGGIDFDPSLLNLQIKRNGRGVPLPLPEQNIESINIEGLYPVIINIQPATIQNFPFLLSSEKDERVPELSMR